MFVCNAAPSQSLFLLHTSISQQVPGLHTMEKDGNIIRYDAEYTIFHDFPKAEKTVVISVPVDGAGPYNGRFQDLLDMWSAVTQCNSKSTPLRVATNSVEGDSNQVGTRGDRRKMLQQGKEENGRRKLSCAFNIYHRSLMPSTYYYAYTGSLPEPPCAGPYGPATTDWRVLDKPMKISSNQLAQLKVVLTNGPCKDNKYAERLGLDQGGFARPIQPLQSRPYWRCRRSAFPLDCERDGGYCDCDAVLCPEDFEL